ncbi:hypothetical protein ACFO3D_12620 [Virgibacillus kekensis]|uniref:YfhD family protein n=1 Tax=Virgibacillus kekensis TaxID=202261 RepID=A0ABV9DJL6_9BACI
MRTKKEKYVGRNNAENNEEISVRTGLRANKPLEKDERFQGESVDEHNRLESANEIIAEKELSQEYNNL